MTNTITIDLKSKTVNIDELRETLGAVIAQYSFLPAPEYRFRQIELMIGLITAMLRAKGRFKIHQKEIEQSDKYYRNALEVYDIESGGWKDAQNMCHKAEVILMVIATSEQLMKLDPQSFVYKPTKPDKDEDAR